MTVVESCLKKEAVDVCARTRSTVFSRDDVCNQSKSVRACDSIEFARRGQENIDFPSNCAGFVKSSRQRLETRKWPTRTIDLLELVYLSFSLSRRASTIFSLL